MKRRTFLQQSAAAALGIVGLTEARAVGKPLNVFLFMTDQQMGTCVGYAGHPYVKTPNLDKLASEGVVFDNAACPTPFCTPSRISLVTGLYPHAYEAYANVGQPEKDDTIGMTADAVLTESILHENGYHTKHRGKWHMGDASRHACYNDTDDGYKIMWKWHAWLEEQFPRKEQDLPEGQAELFGFPLYMTDAAATAHKIANEQGFMPQQDISLIGRTPIPPEYTEDSWITRDCLELLDKYGQEPFMITCSVHPPHAFWVAPDPYYSMYDPASFELPKTTRPDFLKRRPSNGSKLYDALGEDGVREFLRCYYAQVSLVDWNVGRVVKKLKEIGQYENTLFVFTSDHGDTNGHHEMISKSVGPAMFWEIMHVPLLMVCPGTIPAGRRVKTGANNVDIMPTILDYVGLTAPKNIHGESLRPYIEGKEDPNKALFGQRSNAKADWAMRYIRTPKWRYNVACSTDKSNPSHPMKPGEPFELFDLEADPVEEHNLANDPKYRKVAQELHERIRDNMKATNDPWADRWPVLPDLPPTNTRFGCSADFQPADGLGVPPKKT